VAKCMKLIWITALTPRWVQKIFGKLFLLKWLPTYSKMSAGIFINDTSTTYKFWEAMGERKEFRNKILKQWENLKLDAMICNVLPHAALPVDCQASTVACNLDLLQIVDYTSCVTFNFIS